jgi:hypothetical protein
MSYDLPEQVTYEWGQDATFGSTSVLHYIVGPRGKVGFVRDLMADITTSGVGSSTVPEIVVGISSGDATYGRYRLGTATGTAYGIGAYSASTELITGNPPRVATDFAGHVVLDGGPYTTGGVAGGTYLTVVPAGRIPASGMVVTNVVNGAGNVPRITLRDPIPPQLVTGQLINVHNVGGATGTNGVQLAISAINTANNWIETSGTFGGAYTTGGLVDIVTVVSLKAGTGGSPAGGGFARVKIQWVGINTP